ncbi:MAG: hypothetical protein K2O24_02650 [Muribaculaceae bacterium]|nr:hypothetical protein [Muribaculaceae bacterium]
MIFNTDDDKDFDDEREFDGEEGPGTSGSLDDDEPNDFFENSAPVEKKPAAPKRPAPKPDEPDYWESEESEFEHLTPSVRTRRFRLWIAVAAVVAVAITAFYLRYFSPYVEDATQFGYVESIEWRGTIFKTYEGVLLPYKELHDTTRLYTRDFIFTAADPSVASELKRMQLAGLPVRVSYRRYHATLPWRGEAKTVITAVDTADIHSILPPEFTPAAHGVR